MHWLGPNGIWKCLKQGSGLSRNSPPSSSSMGELFPFLLPDQSVFNIVWSPDTHWKGLTIKAQTVKPVITIYRQWHRHIHRHLCLSMSVWVYKNTIIIKRNRTINIRVLSDMYIFIRLITWSDIDIRITITDTGDNASHQHCTRFTVLLLMRS